MKVLLDANIFISYLLAPGQPRTITEVVKYCFSTPSIELVAPQELLTEITRKVQEKEYLRTHIQAGDLADLLETLELVADFPPRLENFPSVFPDPDDDYLFAYALAEEVDYLVTGDRALLELKGLDEVQIVQVPEFWRILGLNQMGN